MPSIREKQYQLQEKTDEQDKKMTALVEVSDLSVAFGATQVVNEISFHINPGETVALVGESGSGKTVSALSIPQLLPYPYASHPSGSIILDGEEMIGAGKSKLLAMRGSVASMIFQEPMTSLNPLHKIGRQVSEMLVLDGKVTRQGASSRVRELFDLVGLDESVRIDAYPHELSGGQRQRVALARAIVRQPRVFLMDEPLSNLDAILRVTTRAELKNLHHRLGVTTIYVTHDQVEAMTLANRIAVMNHGKLLQFDKPQVIFDDPSSKFVAGFIGSPAMNLIDGRVENKKFISDSLTTSFDIDYEGDITLGVRPDKIQIANDSDTNNGSAKVYSVELTGEANLVTFKSNNQNLIVKTDKNTHYDIDSVLKLNFNKEDCYFFDINSEERLRI